MDGIRNTLLRAVLAVAVCAAAVALLVVGFLLFGPGCSNVVVSERTSPSGAYVAFIRHLNCGATTSGATTVGVRPAFLPTAFVMLGHADVLGVEHCHAIDVEWLGEGRLAVTVPQDTTYRKVDEWRLWPLWRASISFRDFVPSQGDPRPAWLQTDVRCGTRF